MKIVINRSDAIGDTILTMPMAQMIKQQYPDAQIVFIISKKSQDLFIDHPFVDDVWVLDHTKSIISKFIYLKEKFQSFAPEYYFFVGGTQLPSIIAKMLKVKFRGGLKSKLSTFMTLNEGVRQKRSMVEMHDSEYNMNLLAPLGIHYLAQNRSQYAPVIKLHEDEIHQHYQSFLSELKKEGLDTSRELLFVHPGMTGHTLNWPSRKYAKLIARLDKLCKGRFIYIISYTPSDKIYIEGVKSELAKDEYFDFKDKYYFFNGALKGLRNYMCVLKKATLFVGPSTGNTHMASTLGVDVVGIYSPIKVQSALRWGPYNPNAKKVKVVVPDVVCGESFYCAGESCPYYECMPKIEVEDVILQIQQLFAKDIN
ncbi:MAG: glycosyltransferase family 9 protein [Bacteriovoracaceae bacterium]|nr:glycosyltransferase family 9 protein [Bacteriovoracaceae bacterium]